MKIENFFNDTKEKIKPDLETLFNELEQLIGCILPENVRQFYRISEARNVKPLFVYYRSPEFIWNRFYPAYFLDFKKVIEVYKKGCIPSHLLALATDNGGNYIHFSIPKKNDTSVKPFNIYYISHEDPFEQHLYMAPSIDAFFKLATLETTENELLAVHDEIDKAINEIDTVRLEAIIKSGRWNVNEHYKYGNTIADLLLIGNGRKYIEMIRMLIKNGALIPRFGSYASKTFTEDEIVSYLKTGQV